MYTKKDDKIFHWKLSGPRVQWLVSSSWIAIEGLKLSKIAPMQTSTPVCFLDFQSPQVRSRRTLAFQLLLSQNCSKEVYGCFCREKRFMWFKRFLRKQQYELYLWTIYRLTASKPLTMFVPCNPPTFRSPSAPTHCNRKLAEVCFPLPKTLCQEANIP